MDWETARVEVQGWDWGQGSGCLGARGPEEVVGWALVGWGRPQGAGRTGGSAERGLTQTAQGVVANGVNPNVLVWAVRVA